MTTRDKDEKRHTDVLRISRSLTRAAVRAGTLYHRKPSQQIEYWASLGRALEAMPGVSRNRIDAALNAALDFDELNAEERVVAVARLNESEATWQAPPMRPHPGGVLYASDGAGGYRSASQPEPKSYASPRARASRPGKRTTSRKRTRR